VYSTCLFCHRQLGRNEALEHFQVGRRLAYDVTTGRLWVICSHCHRWNLSPIETRWEAIEDAEREFSSTRLRVSTDNIALAQLREGLELVRIGKPPKLELAGWRYGNLFAKRWRKHAVVASASIAGASGYMAFSLGKWLMPSLAQLSWIGTTAFLGYQAVHYTNMYRDRRKIRFHVRDDDAQVVGLTHENVRGAALLPVVETGDWRLQFDHRKLRREFEDESPTGYSVLRGDTALRAIATMMPYLNRSGGREKHVREAIGVIENNASVLQLLTGAAHSRDHKWKRVDVKLQTFNVTLSALPSGLRLAMEMVLHEESERNALEGELETLHERWKEAEEIGRIADGLL
jgi:hypothetical protein